MASARPSRPHVSRTRTATAVAVTALVLAGCSATNPITTAVPYNVVDGVAESVSEDVGVRNLIVLAAEEGAPGVLLGAVANGGREDVEVTLSPEGDAPVTVDVPARGTVLLGGEEGETVELDAVAVAPGSFLTITASAPGGGDVPIRVPVLDGSLPEYADLVPEADGD